MPNTPVTQHPPLPIIGALTAKRRRLGMNRQDLADRLGVSAAAIQSWERYCRSPDAHTLVRWATALGYELTLQFAAPPIPTPHSSLEATHA